MHRRCSGTLPRDRANYLGRGITVSQAWHDFSNFLKDMGPRPTPDHTLDRIDNDGPYTGPCPEYPQGNCRWATRAEQNRNTRTNRHLTYQGRTQTMAEWCREQTMMSPKAFESRLLRGLSIERAMMTPPRGQSKLFRYAAFNGETLHLSEWDRRMKFPRNTITGRLRLGWSIEEAITTPLRLRRWFRRP